MKTTISVALLLCAWAATVVWAAEKKIKLEDVPPAVQQAIKDASKGATLVGVATDTENGKTEYEAELRVNGHGKDISFDETGKLLTTEEEVPMDSIPSSAKAAIEKQAEGGKVRRVEKITKADNSIVYEAALTKNGQKSEVLVAPDGSPGKED